MKAYKEFNPSKGICGCSITAEAPDKSPGRLSEDETLDTNTVCVWIDFPNDPWFGFTSRKEVDGFIRALRKSADEAFGAI